MNGRRVFAVALSAVLLQQVVSLEARAEDGEPAAEQQLARTETSAAAAFEPSAVSAQNLTLFGSGNTGAHGQQVDLRPGRMTDRLFDSPTGAYRAFGVGMFVAAGADLASTELGLSRPGVYEANPVQGNRNIRILTHAAAPVFMYWVTDRIHKNGKPKLALLTRIGFTVAYSYAMMHNVRTASLAP